MKSKLTNLSSNKIDDVHFIGLCPERYDIPEVYLYIEKFKTFPSSLQFRGTFNLKKLIEVFQEENIDIFNGIVERVVAPNGNLTLQSLQTIIKEGIIISITNNTGIHPLDKVEASASSHSFTNKFYDEDDEDEKLNKDEYSFTLRFLHNSELNMEVVHRIIQNLVKKQIHLKTEGKIYIITKNRSGLDLTPFKLPTIELDLDLNYNEGFKETYNYMFDKLNDKEKNKGVVLLHGDPGTGKTSLIKHLISELREKKVIYITPDMTHEITEPGFLTFLLEHPNSILVVEDAETILKSRKGSGNQSIANLLNLTDGLLSDCVNMQMICTFNCDINDIDSALMRKGRLIGKYKFEALTKEKAQILSDKLGFKTKIDKPMTLADIYNQNNKSFEQGAYTPVGFKK